MTASAADDPNLPPASTTHRRGLSLTVRLYATELALAQSHAAAPLGEVLTADGGAAITAAATLDARVQERRSSLVAASQELLVRLCLSIFHLPLSDCVKHAKSLQRSGVARQRAAAENLLFSLSLNLVSPSALSLQRRHMELLDNADKLSTSSTDPHHQLMFEQARNCSS